MGEQNIQDIIVEHEAALPEDIQIDISEAPKKNEPPVDSPRWNEVYGKMKNYERSLEALREHNSKLEEKLNSTLPLSSTTTDIDNQISELTIESEKAFEDGDLKKYHQLTSRITDLRVEKKFSVSQVNNKKQPDIDVAFQVAFESFVTDNPWFEDDDIMKAAATVIDSKLSKDAEWGKKSHRVRLNEVARQTKEKFGMGKKIQYYSAVEGVGSMPSTPKNVIRLSAKQREVARMMFGNNDEAELRYARQVAKMQGGS